MNKLVSIVLMVIFLLFIGCGDDFMKTLPSQKVELSRYLGTWYEIARIPSWFESDLYGVTATYSLKSDGQVEVRNSGYQGNLKGELKTAIGNAWLPNSDESGRLKVSFFWPVAADYVVVELDKDYTYAMVGSGKDYLWILSRTKKLDEATYRTLLERAKALGFNVSKLEKVAQPE